MCGFTGFLGGDASLSLAEQHRLLTGMTNTIQHRGPDSAGYWADPLRQVGLGHRRLAIIDLTAAGHQPMHSANQRYVIAFNGEIYNHLDLREKLKPEGSSSHWRGHSDTETLLAGFQAWGIEKTIENSTGMFAFAVWDQETKVLTLGRDRLGEKPIYYGWTTNSQSPVFLFGSELKALKAHSSFKSEVCRDALALFMRHNYIPAPYSIYKNIYKLLPGCLLNISLENPEPVIKKYWQVNQAVLQGTAPRFEGTKENAVQELDTLLKKVIHGQMISDVPLGAFLSGGIDSSLVVSLMQELSAKPIKTFTIGFNEAEFDEAPHAKSVAKHIGTEHTELFVTAKNALDVIPKLGQIYDEPFADPSQIPTFLVSELAGQKVKVALSGDGGDELFCGYGRYAVAEKLWRPMSLVPERLREMISKGILSVSPSAWNEVSNLIPRSRRGDTNIGDKLHKGAALLSAKSIDSLYYSLISHINDPAQMVVGIPTELKLTSDSPVNLLKLPSTERMMMFDLVTYLPDDILVKVDRAAMANSLETRVPLLDHEVVDFAWKLPLSIKLHKGITKWPLKKLLEKYVPNHLIDRPKMGFGVPIKEWLRGPLREWGEALLAEKRLNEEGYFHTSVVRKKWKEHLSGERNWGFQIWNILMFQLWLDSNK